MRKYKVNTKYNIKYINEKEKRGSLDDEPAIKSKLKYSLRILSYL